MTLRKIPFENIVGNSEKQHFPLFPTMFSTVSKTEIIVLVTIDLLSAIALNLVQSQNLPFG